MLGILQHTQSGTDKKAMGLKKSGTETFCNGDMEAEVVAVEVPGRMGYKVWTFFSGSAGKSVWSQR